MKPVSLTELRKKIDRVDIRIVRLIQKRMILAIAIGQLKKSNRQPVEIKQREKKVLANWERQATGLGLDKKTIIEIARLLIRVSKFKEKLK